MSEVIAAWLYVACPMLGIGLIMFLVLRAELNRQLDFFVDWNQRIEDRLQWLERDGNVRD